MAWTLIDHGHGTGVPAVTLNTLGADFIVIVTGDFTNTLAPSDGPLNVYSHITGADDSSTGSNIWYCSVGPGSTSSSHVFNARATGASISVAAFSGSAASPLDQQAVNHSASTTSLQFAASITPSEGNELVIAGYGNNGNSPAGSIDSGFAAMNEQVASAGFYYGAGLSYKIQGSSPASLQPTLSWSASCTAIIVMASFKSAAGGGGGGGGGIVARLVAARQAVNRAGTY